MTPQKRAFDLVTVFVMLLWLGPILLVVLLVMLFTTGRPLFYPSERINPG